MPNENYKRGARSEYYVMDRLKKKGFSCIRSAGSHTPVDIVAGRAGKGFGIQVKRLEVKENKDVLSSLAHNELIDFCKEIGLQPMVAFKNESGFWQIEHLIKGGRRPL